MAVKLIVEGFDRFGGKHCETASLKKTLDFHGLHLSEEMLLGLGGGAGFIYWHTKSMSSPFIGVRQGKVAEILVTACRRIGAAATVLETGSPGKGHEQLIGMLKEGNPAICYGDLAFLPYFPVPETSHFGGHAFVVFGLDEEEDKVYVSDRARKPVIISVAELQKARASPFKPFPPKNRLLSVGYPRKVIALDSGIREAVKECCAGMLTPPISNMGLPGIKKWAGLVMKWAEHFSAYELLTYLINTYIYTGEIGGTGGNAFRTMYAGFLEEAGLILNKPLLKEVAGVLREAGSIWAEIGAAALPENQPALRLMRELLTRRYHVFREQGNEAMPEVQEIGVRIKDEVERAVAELQNNGATLLLQGLKQKILECHAVEEKAFRLLERVFTIN
ncbi:MAG: BtrH N-terminal domain-containing protein [Bacillota bacterium]